MAVGVTALCFACLGGMYALLRSTAHDAGRFAGAEAGKRSAESYLLVDGVPKIVDHLKVDSDFLQDVKGRQGERGEKGDKGERGDRGERGEQGVRGDKGETGPQGPKGVRGEHGRDGRNAPDQSAEITRLAKELSETKRSIGVFNDVTKILRPGTTILELPTSTGGVLVNLRCAGQDYDYRYLLVVAHNGYGDPGTHVEIAKLRDFDGTGHKAIRYERPRFSVDKNGALLLRNDSYPNDGSVTVHYSVTELSR